MSYIDNTRIMLLEEWFLSVIIVHRLSLSIGDHSPSVIIVRRYTNSDDDRIWTNSF
jgi:hypothetical protein